MVIGSVFGKNLPNLHWTFIKDILTQISKTNFYVHAEKVVVSVNLNQFTNHH